MKTLTRAILLFLLFLALLSIYGFQFQIPIARQGLSSSTPTYDPFVETPLPPNPTELELGQNLYWHWCMPCHGDKGQGLTDEFRGAWEPDHQNCWARGCHAGHREDEGFPIPTTVPSLVDDSHLAQFPSLKSLSDFLQATHPPQSPGVLKSEEYRAIALFVFARNGRLLSTLSFLEIVSTPTEVLVVPQVVTSSLYFVPIIIIAILILLTIIVFLLKRRRTHMDSD